MKMSEVNSLDQLISAVQANPRYRAIHPGLIGAIGQAELLKRRSFKEAVKATRNKLHQVGGAYHESRIDTPRWSSELAELPALPSNPAVQDYCRQVMAQHASTRERLPMLERFFNETLLSVIFVTSVPSTTSPSTTVEPLTIARGPSSKCIIPDNAKSSL